MPQPDEHSVFINIPYDKGYERILVTIVAALICIGRKPRCTLEIPEGGEGRLNRIHDLLESCRVSIHDLSMVGTPVRFNMPFELGLACALNKHNGPHTFILFEKKKYRLDRTLSDIKGCDPYIHKGTMLGVVHGVLESLASEDNQPEPTRVHRLAIDLWQTAKDLKKRNRKATIFNRTLFSQIVAAGTVYAVQREFIPEIEEGDM